MIEVRIVRREVKMLIPGAKRLMRELEGSEHYKEIKKIVDGLERVERRLENEARKATNKK